MIDLFILLGACVTQVSPEQFASSTFYRFFAFTAFTFLFVSEGQHELRCTVSGQSVTIPKSRDKTCNNGFQFCCTFINIFRQIQWRIMAMEKNDTKYNQARLLLQMHKMDVKRWANKVHLCKSA